MQVFSYGTATDQNRQPARMFDI